MEKDTKRGPGRPPSPDKLERMTVFLPADVAAKVKAHGQEWMRAVLRKAKPPKS